jgi:hypothetical protein
MQARFQLSKHSYTRFYAKHRKGLWTNSRVTKKRYSCHPDNFVEGKKKRKALYAGWH